MVLPVAIDGFIGQETHLVIVVPNPPDIPTLARRRGETLQRLELTPLELLERLAALIPPPRRHRHRYYGVLAPHAPLRGKVTALASAPVAAVEGSPPLQPATEPAAATIPRATTPSPSAEGKEEGAAAEEAIPRRAARDAWALLLARIYEAFPLV